MPVDVGTARLERLTTYDAAGLATARYRAVITRPHRAGDPFGPFVVTCLGAVWAVGTGALVDRTRAETGWRDAAEHDVTTTEVRALGRLADGRTACDCRVDVTISDRNAEPRVGARAPPPPPPPPPPFRAITEVDALCDLLEVQ